MLNINNFIYNLIEDGEEVELDDDIFLNLEEEDFVCLIIFLLNDEKKRWR